MNVSGGKQKKDRRRKNRLQRRKGRGRNKVKKEKQLGELDEPENKNGRKINED